LRHETEEFAVRRQVSQIREWNKFIADLPAEFSNLLMRPFEKVLDQAKFVNDFQRRRMNRVTTKIAQKIGVLLKHDDIHTRACEQKAEHHSGRPAARDATTRCDWLLHICSDNLRAQRLSVK